MNFNFIIYYSSFFISLSVLNGRIALGILKLRFPPNSNDVKKEY